MDHEAALKKLGELTEQNANLKAEVETLRKHKGELETDLGKARKAKEGLEAELADTKTKLLSEAQQQELEQLRSTVASYEGITAEQAKEARDWRSKRERADVREKAWRSAGFDPEAAANLRGVDDLEYKLEPTKDGEQSFVKSDNRWVPLAQYAEQQYKPFLSVLKGSPQPNVVTQDGRNTGGNVKSVEEIAEQKRRNPTYKGL